MRDRHNLHAGRLKLRLSVTLNRSLLKFSIQFSLQRSLQGRQNRQPLTSAKRVKNSVLSFYLDGMNRSLVHWESKIPL